MIITAFIFTLCMGRIIVGLGPFIKPKLLVSSFHFPPSHENQTAVILGRLFGVRDIFLGGISLYILFEQKGLFAITLLINALIDFCDALIFYNEHSNPELKDLSIRGTAFAGTIGVTWIICIFFLS